MTKLQTLFILSGILFIAPRAMAGQFDPQRIYEVGIGSMTVTTINVSSTTATQVDNPTLAGRTTIEVQNIDATVNLWCGANTSIAVNGARKIGAGNSWIVAMTDVLGRPYGGGAFHLYCLSDSSAATSKAAVTQAY